MMKTNTTRKKKASNAIKQLVPLRDIESISSKELEGVAGGWKTGGWQSTK